MDTGGGIGPPPYRLVGGKMSTEQFLNAVLPTQGHRFALTMFGKLGDEDFRPGQKHFPIGATSDLIGYAQWGSKQGANAYFAVAGFSLVLNEEGKPRRVAQAANWHRCLRLDIDVGADKPYTTKRDALAQLLMFGMTFQLPAPWIVDSGGGLHVYWAFDRDVDLQDWVPMANRLRAACEAFGLHCDHTATCDAARILRVPGTFNNKPVFIAFGNPPTVRILQAGDSVAPELVVANFPQITVPIFNPALVPAALRNQRSELQANMHQPYFMAGVLKQCPGMLAMLRTGGATAQEPLWKATLDLINKSDDTAEEKWALAQYVSKGHPGYSESGLVRKWQQVQEQDYHPPTCGRMASAGMPECATCPFNGKISSPLTHGRRTVDPHPDDAPMQQAPVSAATESAVPPPPVAVLSPQLVAAPPTQVGVFLIDQSTTVRLVDGKVGTRTQILNGYPCLIVDGDADEQGVKKQYSKRLLDYKLLAVERMLDNSGDRSVVVLSFERGLDGVCQIEVDNRDFAEPKSFYNKLYAQGLYAARRHAADFVEKFMTDFLTSLQRARAASQIAARCGWSHDLNSFVLGTYVFHRDGRREHIRTSVARGEMEGYHMAGDEAEWRRAFDIVLAGGVDRQAVVALAMAGPLMVFTGLDGVLLNAYSPESGVGKSTLCDAALSVWGSPNTLRKDFRDTANATFKLASVVGNMPMVIDEFTNVDGRALSDYVYTITQGREKHRLGSDSKIVAPEGASRWCLAAIATSNNSVHDKLQAFRSDSSAEASRVFEMRMYPLSIPPERMGKLKQQLHALRSSYGFLGPQLVQLFMAKSPEYWRQTVMTRISRWDREVSSSSGDRFRSAVCALIEVGSTLGAALGFNFDTKGVQEELRRHWTKQANEFEAERRTPMDFVNHYVVKSISDFAVISEGPTGFSIVNQQVPKKFLGEIRGKPVGGKYSPDTVMIPLDFLRTHVRENNGNYKAVLEWLTSSTDVVRFGKLRFLDGTMSAITTQAVEFHYDRVMGSATIPTTEALP